MSDGYETLCMMKLGESYMAAPQDHDDTILCACADYLYDEGYDIAFHQLSAKRAMEVAAQLIPTTHN